MNSVVRKMFMLLLPVIALAFTGCAGLEFAPKRATWYYHPELPAADRAVAKAQADGKDKECPKEFNAAAKMRDDAYDVYLSCKTQEGIDMAKKAVEMVNALCPKPPAPTPCPTCEPPAPKPTPEKAAEKEVAVIRIVNFDFDKYNIKKVFKPELDMAAQIIKKYPNPSITIDGYTDNKGSFKYNMKLSIKRAEAAKAALVKNGIDGNKIKTVGHSYNDPIADNKTKEGRAKNRRAEIHIVGK
ncbi:OmpA family protein [Candidatus Magnetominusculus xianensis]|uniref:Outer membrane protein n=1 Tax=Candidatus Magnetominusculus xianensis TaxID=1748249 RepID=A0ABR5SIC0_9BACT|nr:OmpA family protein [Candidatus Magnetominusculus xianensis]KWT91003.1 outer membrane protein [Candidatus Magnetominusculus xianensis]MBF0402604.1 OmpA family protein [Nitrospirota bacterium]